MKINSRRNEKRKQDKEAAHLTDEEEFQILFKNRRRKRRPTAIYCGQGRKNNQSCYSIS